MELPPTRQRTAPTTITAEPIGSAIEMRPTAAPDRMTIPAIRFLPNFSARSPTTPVKRTTSQSMKSTSPIWTTLNPELTSKFGTQLKRGSIQLEYSWALLGG